MGGARTESSLMPRNYGLCDPGRKSDRMGADGQLLTRSSHVQLLYACLIRHTQKGVDLCPEKWGGHSDNNATAGVGNGGPATRRTRFDEEEPITFRWLLTVREMNDLSHDAPQPSLNRRRLARQGSAILAVCFCRFSCTGYSGFTRLHVPTACGFGLEGIGRGRNRAGAPHPESGRRIT